MFDPVCCGNFSSLGILITGLPFLKLPQPLSQKHKHNSSLYTDENMWKRKLLSSIQTREEISGASCDCIILPVFFFEFVYSVESKKYIRINSTNTRLF